MSVVIAWDNSKNTVIRVTFEGQWAVADMFRIIEEGTRMMQTVDHTVDSIFDFTLSSVSPSKLLSTLERMEETHNENERLLIIVRANAYLKSLIRVAKLVAPKTFANVHFADTLDAAYTIIRQQTAFSFV